MHVALLLAGLVSVLFGVVMAYAGYVNFDFSYGGTLAIVAAITVVGGLLLIGSAACLAQLRRIARALQAAPHERAATSTAAMASSEARSESDGEEPRLPVLPPRPARATASAAAAAAAPAVALADAAATGDAGRSASGAAMDGQTVAKATEWPRVRAADRVWKDDDAAERATENADTPDMGEDVMPEAGGAHSPILKSGVIEGMAYTLYADGSVEAELPQGILRFSSVAEWREYLRPQR